MPRDDAIVFSDLIGKVDLLRVSCEKCGRDGCYGLGRLIEKRGRDAKMIDWLDEITADCPKKSANNMNDCARRGVRICQRCCRSRIPISCPLYPGKRTWGDTSDTGEES